MGRAAQAGASLAPFRDMFKVPGWNRFVHAAPGQRFQERYRRNREEHRGAFKRCALVCAGLLLSLLGVFFLAFPGPGIPILALGLALVAQESRLLARLLDRAELKMRGWWKKLRR